MSSGYKDRIWIFALVLLATFLLVFSGLAVEYIGPDQAATTLALATGETGAADDPAVAQKGFDREFLATAYCDYGITKSGVLAATGIVAADPKVLPIGSIIEIEAGRYSGIYTVMDTGELVKGDKIDIFIPSYEEAVRFGARKVIVRILRHGWNPQADIPTSG